MTDAQKADEASLIEGLRAGNQEAFRLAVRIHSPGMLAVARYFVDVASAEDVVQDTWLAVIDAIQSFEGRSGLKTWLQRIVANRAKNHLRSTQREVSLAPGDALDPALASRFESGGRWSVPPTLQFHEHAEALMESNALNDCLDKHLSALPENQRSAILLFEAHQHKSVDVCNILDVSASNLRVLIHRARQTIFLMVEQFQETGEC